MPQSIAISIVHRKLGPAERLRRATTAAAQQGTLHFLRGLKYNGSEYGHPDLQAEYLAAYRREVRDQRDAK